MDSRLTEVLVCPVCKGPLTMNAEKTEMRCSKCGLAFPVSNGIPVMLTDRARKMSPEEIETSRASTVKA